MANAIETLLAQLEPEIEDAEEEAFLLFAQTHPSQNLGFIDSKASSLDLTINGHDLTITQSPAILSSNRANGTTGAVVWKVTPLFASWLASSSSSQAGDGPSNSKNNSSSSRNHRKTTKGHHATTTNSKANILFRTGVLSSTSTVLELGCGVSALVGLATSPLVHRYILTDQPYVARFVEQNISQNASTLRSSKKSSSNTKRKAPGGTSRAGGGGGGGGETSETGKLTFHPLDWELDTLTPTLCIPNLVVACDCVYNDALIAPLVQTCVDACKLQLLSSSSTSSSSIKKEEKVDDDEAKNQDARPAICVVAQQLRAPEVFEAWLREFMGKGFRVWRVPDSELPEGLRSSSGFVVHVGILGEALNQSQR